MNIKVRFNYVQEGTKAEQVTGAYYMFAVIQANM